MAKTINNCFINVL